jgi:hypothetical protein
MAPHQGCVQKGRVETAILSQRDHRIACGVRLRQLIDAVGTGRGRYVRAARDMGIEPNHLGNWMRGHGYPGQYELYKYCRKHGVTMDWVFLGDPSGLPHRVSEKLLKLGSAPEDRVEQARPASEKVD